MDDWDDWDDQIMVDMATLGAAVAVKGEAVDDEYRQALTIGRNGDDIVRLHIIDNEGAAVGIDIRREDAVFLAAYLRNEA